MRNRCARRMPLGWRGARAARDGAASFGGAATGAAAPRAAIGRRGPARRPLRHRPLQGSAPAASGCPLRGRRRRPPAQHGGCPRQGGRPAVTASVPALGTGAGRRLAVSGERLRRRDRGTRHVRPAGPRGGWQPRSAPIEGRETGEVSLGAPTAPGTGPQAATPGVRPSGTAVAATAVPEGRTRRPTAQAPLTSRHVSGGHEACGAAPDAAEPTHTHGRQGPPRHPHPREGAGARKGGTPAGAPAHEPGREARSAGTPRSAQIAPCLRRPLGRFQEAEAGFDLRGEDAAFPEDPGECRRRFREGEE